MLIRLFGIIGLKIKMIKRKKKTKKKNKKKQIKALY